jgi:hypothetical protein
MDKFLAINADVREGLAASGLEVYPEDYTGDILNENRFLRYSVIFPNSEAYDYDRKAVVEGMLMLRLFSEKGYGGHNSYVDAAALNSVFEDKQFNNKTFFSKSMLSQPQDDKENEALVMVIYSIPFTYHE